MSSEALRLFLYGPTRESSLGAKAAAPNAKYQKRQLEIDDAVALLPVLHGVFRLNRSSVVPLQKPLLGLQLPEVSATGQWNIRAKHAIAVVLKHLASLDINFHGSIKKNGGSVPFAKVLTNINKVELALVESLERHKTTLVANASAARTAILKEMVAQVQSSLGREALRTGKVGDAPLAIELTNILQSTWETASQKYADLPFEHKSTYATDKSWSDFVNLSEFWKSKFSEDAVFTEYEKSAIEQETYQIDAAIASIRLGILVYTRLIAVMEADTFETTLLKEYYAYQLSTATTDPSLNRISAKERTAWERYVHTYFKELLVERLELLQANIYSFNVMAIGKGERAADLADSLTITLARSVTAPLFEFTMPQPYYRKDTQAQKEAKDISEAEITRGKQYEVHVTRVVEFFNAIKLTSLDKEDIARVEASAAALFEPLPTVRVKSVHMRDITYPSLERNFTKVLANRSITEHPKIAGDNVANVGVRLAVTPDTEIMQPFKAILIKQIDPTANIVSLVTKHIVHAVGLSDSAFVATYYANKSAADLGTYQKLFPNILTTSKPKPAAEQKPAAEPEIKEAGADAPSPYLIKPAWVAALKADSEIIKFKDSLTIPEIDKLFVFKNNPSAALTHPARPPSAKSGKKAKKASDKKPKGDQPKKGGKAGENKKGGQKDKPKDQNNKQQGGNKANTKGGKKTKK